MCVIMKELKTSNNFYLQFVSMYLISSMFNYKTNYCVYYFLTNV